MQKIRFVSGEFFKSSMREIRNQQASLVSGCWENRFVRPIYRCITLAPAFAYSQLIGRQIPTWNWHWKYAENNRLGIGTGEQINCWLVTYIGLLR